MAFLGVAFFAAAFFLGAAAFFAALGAAGAVVLVTRPDFVFPRTRDTSFSTAGGAAALRGLLALALGLAAGFAAGFAAAVFFAAGFVAGFFAAGAFLVAAAFAFYQALVSGNHDNDTEYEQVQRPSWPWGQPPSSRASSQPWARPS